MEINNYVIKTPMLGVLNLTGRTEEVYREGKGSHYFEFNDSNYRWLLDEEDNLHFWETDKTPIEPEDLLYPVLCDLLENVPSYNVNYV